NHVEAGYFETMATPILPGRAFDGHDTGNSPRVAIVNETLARRFWPGRETIGHRIRLDAKSGPVLEVIGVARECKYTEILERPLSYVYLPYRQNFASQMTLHVYTAIEPASLVPALRREIQVLAPDLPVLDIRTMKEMFENK